MQSDSRMGLKSAEVQQRLREYGYNEVPEKKVNPLLSLVKKFWDLTAWMLEVIIVLSWILGQYADVCMVAHIAARLSP